MEYITKNAVVRVHGTTDREKLEKATARFLKKALQQKAAKERKQNERTDF